MSHPFLSALQGQQSSTQRHPFLDALGGGEDEPVNSSLAIAQSNEAAMAAERKKKLEELLRRPDISPEQRERIQGMLAEDNPQWRTGSPVDLARGVGAGVVSAGAGLLDLGAAAAGLVLPMQGVRDYLAESQAVAGEIAPDKTVLGAAGQVAGHLGASTVPYGMAARGTAGVLAKAVPRLEPILTAGGRGLAGRLKSAGGNVLAGLPIDAAQAALQSSPEDRWQNFLVSTGAAAIFGAAVPSPQLRASARKTPEVRPEYQLPSSTVPQGFEGSQLQGPGIAATGFREAAETDPTKLLPASTTPVGREQYGGPTGPAIPVGPLSRIAEIEAERAALNASESTVGDYRLNRDRNATTRQLFALDAEQKQLERELAIQRWKGENPDREWDALTKRQKKNWYAKVAEQNEAAKAAATPAQVDVPKLSAEQATAKVTQNAANGVYDRLAATWWPKVQAGDINIGEPGTDLPTLVALFKHGDGSLHTEAEFKDLLMSFDQHQFMGGDPLEWANGRAVMNAPPNLPSKIALPGTSVVDQLEARMAVEPDPQVKVELQKQIVKEQEAQAAKRFKPKTLDANMPPELGTGLLAGIIGYGTGEGSDEERMARAAKYAAYGAGGVVGAKLALKRVNAIMAKKVAPRKIYINGKEHDAPSLTRKEIGKGYSSVQELLRSYWVRGVAKVSRPSVVAELMAEKTGLSRGSDAINFAATLRNFGRHAAQAESALSTRVVAMDAEGNERVFYNRGLGQILSDHFGGDILRLSDLSQAHAEDELYDIARREGKPFSGAMKQDLRTALKGSATPQEIEGLKALREWHGAMVEAALLGTKVSPEGLAAMKQQLWYTPLNKIVDDFVIANFIDDDTLHTPKGIMPRKQGSADPVLNTFEAAVENTARMFRAGEELRARAGFIDFMESLPTQELRDLVARRIDNAANPEGWKPSAAAKHIAKKMNMSEQASKELADLLVAGHKRGSGKLQVFRNGVKEDYEVNRDIIDAFKSLQPFEHNGLVRFFGGPARLLAQGVALHPWFTFYQSIIDGMAIAAQERYGLSLPDKVTGGYASVIRGWYHAAKQTKSYVDFKGGGGPNTFQSLEWNNPKTAVEATRRAGLSRWDTAIAQLKEVKPMQFLRTLQEPLMEAAKVGAYLRALDHSATVLDAVNHAQNVAGNFKMQGAAASIRALNHMTPFLRPSIAALDKFAQNVGLHPLAPAPFKSGLGKTLEDRGFSSRAASQASLVAKSFAAITVPTITLWAIEHANDDQEIREMRQTSMGQKYWFIRSPVSDQIFRIRKPHVLGQLFGTSAEAALDKFAQQNPMEAKQVAAGMLQDAWLNLLPTAGVVPLSLIPGIDLSTGFAITPSADARVEPSLQGANRASLPARVVAEKVGDMTRELDSDKWFQRALKTGLSPAGIDYVVKSTTGMLGDDALRIITNAVEWAQEGAPPPAEELAGIRRALVKTPSLSIRPIEAFYKRDERISKVAATMADLALSDPQRLQLYVAQHQNDIALVPAHREVKAELSELRRAINDVRAMPGLSMERKRAIEEKFILAMVRIARAVEQPLERLDQRKR